MKCPNCESRVFEVYEAGGYVSGNPIKECGCGHIWRILPARIEEERIDVIRQGKPVRV
ncbi:MAG: hypothetical protein HGA36_03965 [Candidatus Moranbacteria bacterium]|nr:hypothetical protein [Candidatus Moranbacteria bacterium]